MRFIILNGLYTAHHNLLGICHQLKIRHLYGTFNFSTQCICMGTGSLFVYGLYRFRGNARPLQTKTVFAVASNYPISFQDPPDVFQMCHTTFNLWQDFVMIMTYLFESLMVVAYVDSVIRMVGLHLSIQAALQWIFDRRIVNVYNSFMK